jgi:hypothetical protein
MVMVTERASIDAILRAKCYCAELSNSREGLVVSQTHCLTRVVQVDPQIAERAAFRPASECTDPMLCWRIQ